MPRLLKELSYLRYSKLSIVTLFAPIFLVGGIAVVGYQTASESIASSDRVVHTYAVMGEIEGELRNILDVESGARGYVISGRDDYLQPYRRAVHEVNAGIKRIRLMTRDNSSQQANLAELEQLAAARLAHSQSLIDARKTSGSVAAMELVNSGRGKNAMDQIREVAARMQNEEERLLTERRDHSIRSAYHVQLACIAFLLADLVVFAAMLTLIVRIGRLQNLVKVCSWTKRIEYEGRWMRFEDYLRERFGVRTTHGMSADAAERMKADLEALNTGTKR